MAPKPQQSTGKTVLIVDDIAFVRKTLSDIYTKAGFKVVGEAADGQEAIKKYMELRPDLVTLDVVMPQMSGLDAAKTLLKMDRTARVIIISAMGQESLIMEAVNIGVKDYLMKPFTSTDVIRATERAFKDEMSAKSAAR